MKKNLLLLFCFVGISTLSYSQAGGSEKSGGFFSRVFHGGQRSHKQMNHFGKQQNDPNIKENGTAYKRSDRGKRKVDGDGFSAPKQGRRKRGKKSGIR